MKEALTHRVEGEGEPLVLLNGGLMSIASWDRFAAPLAARFRVVRCDFRGQLLSPGVPEPRLDAHVDDLLALLDTLEIPAAHLAGASFGALVALRLAARQPERVLSLAAITATDRVPDETWRDTVEMRELARQAASGGDDRGDGGKVLDFLLPRTYTPAYLEAQSATFAFYRQWVAGLPPVYFQGLEQILSVLGGLDLTPDLAAIRCPTLVVAADGDRTFPLERSRALAAGIAGARLEVVPDAAHGLIVEQSERVLEILLGFLESLPWPATPH